MLIGNFSSKFKGPIARRMGASESIQWAGWDRSGSNRARYFGWSSFDKVNGVPQGDRPPYCWILPQINGGLASFNNLVGAVLISNGNLAAGKAVESTISASIAISIADLGLITQAISIINSTGLIDAALLLGSLEAAANIAGNGQLNSVPIGAINDATAILLASGAISASTSCMALGDISADIQPYTTLSPENLANAVWTYMANNPSTGSTLEELMKKLGKVEFLALK